MKRVDRGNGDRRSLDELLQSTVAGDASAIEELLARFAPTVQLMAVARLSSISDRYETAEEIAQVVLAGLPAALQRHGIASETSLRAFTSEVVKNRVIDELRRRTKRPVRRFSSIARAASDVSSIPALWNAVAHDDTSPSSRAARSEQFDALLALIDAMPDRQREALILAYFDGLNSTESGVRLGLSRTAAANAIIRATLELQRRWNISTTGRNEHG